MILELSPVRKAIKDLKQKVDRRSQHQFTWQRDKQENLILSFAKKEAITLPLITLRPYQKDIQHKLFHEGFKRFFLAGVSRL